MGCGERVRVDRSSASKNFKMVLFRVTGSDKFGRVFSLGLLLLVTARVSRQQGTRQIFSITPGQWHYTILSVHA